MNAPELTAVVARALAEDIGIGDVTSGATVPEGARGRARIVQKQAGVVFGLGVVAETMRQCGVEDVDNLVVEGQWRDGVPAEVLFASGPAPALLAAERTALNFLGHLSGVATLTARFVEAVAGTGAAILDTRKTTPGLRELEKAAVLAGGGRNHRMGLYDAILIKENHIALAGSLAKAVHAARTQASRAGGRGRVPQPRRGRLRARHRRRHPAARQHGHRDPARGGAAARRKRRQPVKVLRWRPPAG